MSGYYGLGLGLHAINSPTRPSEKVGGLVQQFPSAAAFSLRGLVDNAGKVVRVRRSSDNHEQDFSASEVVAGDVTTFVNQTIDLPLDLKALDSDGERTGAVIPAAAAYSLRNLKSAGTAVTSSGDTAGDTSGNFVVQVQRQSDSKIKSFTATEVADGTLANFAKERSAVPPVDADIEGHLDTGYSLRNLSASGTSVTSDGDTDGDTTDNYVVQVRRDADNKVRSFTASQVGSNLPGDSAVVDFVNESFASQRPLDATSDAVAAYSLRNLKLGGTLLTTTDDTGDQRTDRFVVQVRRSSDNTLKSFTASEITDGTLVAFVGSSNNGRVRTWYDQSGNNKHALQTDTAKQPSIVSSGTLVTGGIEFDGFNDHLSTSSGLNLTSSDDLSVFLVANPDATSGQHPIVSQEDGTGTGRSFVEIKDGNITSFLGGGVALNFGSASASQSIITLLYDDSANTLDAFKDGSQSGSQKTSITAEAADGALNIGTNKAGSQFFDGKISEVIIYFSDQTAKRIPIEQNIGSAYGITVTHQRNGFVRTLYDQARLGITPAHARQTTNALQPFIVENGSLITGMNSKPGIKFVDTSGHFLQATLENAIGSAELFGLVAVKVVAGADNGHIISVANPSVDNKFLAVKEEATESHFTVSNTTERSINDELATSDKIIRFETNSATSYKVATNGATYTTGTTSYGTNFGSGDNFNTVFIGKSKTSDAIGSGRMFNGTFHEAVLFVEIQTASVYNCIESNMGTEFNVSAAIKEDGTVRTWYDQSGNNQHALQTTVANQPTIVSSGTLLTEGNSKPTIKFNVSSSTFLLADNFSATQAYSTILKATAEKASDTQQIIDGDTTAGSFIQIGTDGIIDIQNGNSKATSADLDSLSSDFIFSTIINGSSSNAFFNGSNVLSNQSPGSNNFIGLTIGKHRTADANYYDNKLSELIIHDSNQSDNRTAFESNIAEHYNIDLPTGFDSGDNSVDGFVTTWYDQSGNGNHLSQATATKQPRLVVNGNLQVVGAKASLKFDGGDVLERETYTQGTLAQPNTMFAVAKLDSNDNTNRKVYDSHLNTARNMLFLHNTSGGRFGYFAGNVRNTGEAADANQHLFTALYNGGSCVLRVDGTQKDSGNAGSNAMTGLVVGSNHDTVNNFWLGDIQELIVYNSDQTTNQNLIESNVTTHYGIT